jgi:hypothetical protein
MSNALRDAEEKQNEDMQLGDNYVVAIRELVVPTFNAMDHEPMKNLTHWSCSCLSSVSSVSSVVSVLLFECFS